MKKESKEIILKNLNFLRLLGFIYQSKTRLSNFDNNKKIEEFIYIKNPIRIEVSFNEFVDCKIINLYIERTDKNLSFNFEDYLLFKGKDKDSYIGLLNESNEKYINRFFSLFKSAVNDDLQDVLDGKTWIKIPKDYK